MATQYVCDGCNKVSDSKAGWSTVSIHAETYEYTKLKIDADACTMTCVGAVLDKAAIKARAVRR